MLKNPLKKISNQILLSYTIPLACLTGLCFSAYGTARNTLAVEAKRNLLSNSKYTTEVASYHLIDAVRRVKGKILNPSEARYFQAYEESHNEFLRNIEILDALAKEQQDTEMEALSEALKKEGERINNVSQRIFLLIEDEDTQRAMGLVPDLESDSVGIAKDTLHAYLDGQLETNLTNFFSAQALFEKTMVVGGALVLITTLLVGWLISQRIRRQMQRMIGVVEQNGVQVAASSTQISASSRQLEATVSEQVASTHQITATTTEIAATSEELNQTIERVADLSESASQMATKGKQDLEGMAGLIEQLTASTATISSKLGQIDDKANNINAVVTAITKVADQTNLLSLNAAIEAEKAGEYGAGFSVVAREIRRLADQTAIATLDIENMVGEMLSSVSAGVMEMDKFSKDVEESAQSITELGTQMAEIIYQVQSLVPQFEIVSNGMNAQAEGAQQIQSAMEQLNDTSQQTADSVKDANQVIVQLSDVAKDLQSEVAHFRLAV